MAHVQTHAASIAAKSASLSDVQAAVSLAATGDIVLIPPGNATWTSTLGVNKAIQLIGAGTNSTQISTTTRGPTLWISLPSDLPVRISGIYFLKPTENRGDDQAIGISGSDSRGLGVPITKLRIDHCLFVGGGRAINPNGRVEGVIDHCTFRASNIAIGVTADDNRAWERPVLPGTANALYIEDCDIQYSDDSKESPIYHQQGGRTVVRNCVLWCAPGSTVGNLIECHGNQNLDTTGSNAFRGQVLLEIYNNTFLGSTSGYRFTHFRGGTVFAFNNTFSFPPGNRIACFALTEEESWQILFFNPLRTTWPAQDQIKNSFFWNNTLNGSPITAVSLWNSNDSTFIRQNRDYWMEAPNQANGSPVGVYASYAPLSYPHPLISDTNPNRRPTPPSNLRVVSTQD